ncbi:MAG: MG2 domain-containing protein, partial [Proteobacteria bacterium]|nr:MG2 domain-containing protein [Pseudomonadota bacterium]
MKIPSLFAPVAGLLRLVSHLLIALLGRFNWQPPRWLTWVGRILMRGGTWLRRNPLPTGILLLAALATAGGGWYGWQWYSHRPVPHTADFRIIAPTVTRYDQSPIVVAPLRVVFAESVAPLALVGKPVVTGLRMEPALAGTWRWSDDGRTLEFKPEGDWPVGQAYSLSFAQEDFFRPGILLAKYQVSFSSAPFSATITAGEFYQDPVDNTLKKLVATVNFSHPVDEASLRRAIALKLAEGLGFRDRNKEPWTMTIDATGVRAYIHSAPLAMPLESSRITLILDKGIGAAKGGDRTDRPIERSVSVPGLYQLTFTDLAVRYINNQQGEPEQVLMFTSSFPVRDEAIGKKVHAWLLPEKSEDRRWTQSTVSEEVLKKAQPLTLRQIPGAEPQNTQHGFVFRAPVKRQIVVKIDEKIEALGGFLAKNPLTELLNTGEYPKMLKLLGEGALLGLNGEKRVGFIAQGMPGMKVEIARVLPGQLHQIIDQNYSQFAQPSVYGDRFDRLVERMEYTRTFPSANESKPLYDFIDISGYLNADGGRRGIFILRITPFDPNNPRREYSDYQDENSRESDRRFILVTDLGLISKRTLDGGQEVFVQSIAGGTPVAGAKVEIIGRNGLAVAEARTDEEGHVRFPGMAELRREKKPIALIASLNNDLSFLPLGRGEHAVDLSRFDTGGAGNALSPNQMSASLFTDRGLYRPGETVHVGSILRAADWNTRIEGMPMEVEILDPRGSVVWNQKKKCPESGFDSIDFTVGEAAPAGTYSVSLFLIQENRRGRWIGETDFRVGDFEPDRMKVTVSLADSKPSGWLRPEEVKALVMARHLFGAAASDRRVTGQMRLTPALPAFKQYPGYRFHVEGVLKEGAEDFLPEAMTSATGEAELQLNLKRFARATYRLRVTAQVYEAEGGRNVAAAEEALISSAAYLIGVNSRDSLDYVTKGAVRSCRWLAVGPDLQPLAVEDLQLALVEYRYLSVLVKQSDGTYKYESRRKEIERDIHPFSLDKGGKDSPLPTTEPGDFAYELRDPKGNVLNRITWTVAGAANLSRSLERNAELQIKLDKASYAPGEKIQISLRAPYTGAGLITIERDQVYAHAWFKTTTTASVQTITVPKELEGNGYVNVQFVRDPNSPEVFMSPLSSGAAPFAVSLAARTLPLTMNPPEQVEPGTTLKLHLASKEAAKAVVFAVDEGILQVARYQTPDPLGDFFR